MSNETFRVGVVQMCTGVDVAPNIASAYEMIREAHAHGADFVLTPENTSSISLAKADIQGHEARQDFHPAVTAFRSLADELKIWLLIGSIGIDVETPGGQKTKYANRSFLFGPEGKIHATYDKIHMFDVDVSERDSWRESETFEAGTEAVGANLPWGGLGMTICYDMRFAHLYRTLAQAGADFFAVPAAFTVPTGEAHWHVLLRARAIETGTFVFAPAQGGTHENGRQTYGRSLIIGPWGEIMAEAGDRPEVLMAQINTSEVTSARARLPSLTHDRDFSLQTPI
jgi:deaminated glutathione amidase